MGTELLRGRQRRYFGYMQDTRHKIDTPESAKSFRSVVSAAQKQTKRIYEPVKTFKPDPAGRSRFADRIVHHAVKTEIPGLLPALNNSSQFDKDGEAALYLRSPDFEQHFERSLHYLWLKRQDRKELCDYFQKHLKSKERARIKQQGKSGKLTGAAAEAYALEQQEYLESLTADPKLHKAKRVSDIPSRIFRQNRKFQASYWDPVAYKNILDPFKRTKNKTPGLDSICHEYWGVAPEYTDLMTCVKEYNRRQWLNEKLEADDLELADAKEQARRLSLFGTMDDEEKRRGMKHIKQLKDYDRESDELWMKQAKLIISAGTYINKIKAGRRFPTPPREVFKRKRKKKTANVVSPESEGGLMASRSPSSIAVFEYLEKKNRYPEPTQGDPLEGLRTKTKFPLPGTPRKTDRGPVEIEPEEITLEARRHRSHHDHHKKRQHKHFHHNYNTEEFYMEMYLHFMNPNEDVSIKVPPVQLMDVKELRKKMNLDENVEQDRKLIELMNADSIEALHVHVHHHEPPPARKSTKEVSPPEVTGSVVSGVGTGTGSGETEQDLDDGAEKRSPKDEQEYHEGHHHDHHYQLSPEEQEHEREILMEHLARLKNPRLTHMLSKAISTMNLSMRPSELTLSSGGTKGSEEHDRDRDKEEATAREPVVQDQWTKAVPKAFESKEDDLDELGDIPENELRWIMSEIQDSKESLSSAGMSSEESSPGEEEEEGEGEGDPDTMTELKLFKQVKKKKDSLAEFMDLTHEFRQRVCKVAEGPQTAMNPFVEAVCVLYPDGSEKKKNKNKSRSLAEKFSSRLSRKSTFKMGFK